LFRKANRVRFPMQDPERTSEADDLSRTLSTLSFDGDVWDDALGRLRKLLGAEAALAYRVGPGGPAWEFEFLRVSKVESPKWQGALERFTTVVMRQRTGKTWAAYNPESPAAWQRNRALSNRQLFGKISSPKRLRALFESVHGETPDQVRVLVCDGARLLGWAGVLSERPLGPDAVGLLQRLVPALRSRMIFDELVRSTERARASLDVALDAIQVPAVLLDRTGRIQHSNEAARRLRDKNESAFRTAYGQAKDEASDVRPVVVRGVPQSWLVTLRPEGGEDTRKASVLFRWALTPRQGEVLALVVRGLSNKQIGTRLGIAEGTVELHLTAIFRKARVESRAELVTRYWCE
jgi:DNA-binding CsgD family transcriptional regulator